MVGWLVLEHGRGRRPALERTRLLGLPLLQARVPIRENLSARALEKRLERAAGALHGEGVRRVLTPPGFGHWPLLEAWGLHGVDPGPLCQALAAPLALAVLERRGVPSARAAVALRGQRVGRAMFQAAEALCPKVRTLAVSAADGAELSRYLREEYGVAALEEGAGPPPDVTVDFAPREAAAGPVLALYGPRPRLEGLGLRPCAGGPDLGVEPLHLLALLWEEGRLPLREIEIFATGAGTN